MAETVWYYGEANQQRGPVTHDQLLELARMGRITGETLLWNEGLPDWRPARQVAEVAALLAEHAAATGEAEPVAVQPLNPLEGEPASVGTLGYQGPSQGELVCTARAVDLLRQTRPWVRFIAILLSLGALLLGTAGLLATGMAMVDARDGDGFGLVVSAGLLYALFTGIYVMLAVYLWRFSSAVNRVVLYRRSNDLEMAIGAQRSFWRLVGIVVIAMLGLWGAMMLVVLLSEIA